jgi:lysophospholipase L1-like esterase
VVVADVALPCRRRRGDPDPRFFAIDQLHVNASGYEIWRKPVWDAIEVSLKR